MNREKSGRENTERINEDIEGRQARRRGTKGQRRAGRQESFFREEESEKRREKKTAGTPTILINPVPGAHSRSLAIESGARSTRNLHKILHSRLQLNPLFIFRARWSLTWEGEVVVGGWRVPGGRTPALDAHDAAHIILARALLSSPSSFPRVLHGSTFPYLVEDRR